MLYYRKLFKGQFQRKDSAMFTFTREAGQQIKIVVNGVEVSVIFKTITDKKAHIEVDLPNNCSIWIDGLKYTPSDKPLEPGATYREVELRTEI